MRGLVDFHCHLDLYPNHAAMVAACENEQIHTLAVTTTPRAWPVNRQLASKTKYVRAALGLHPQLVAEHHTEITLWEEYLPQARYIGEVGLDAGPRFYRSFEQQKAVFARVLQKCSGFGDKILTIHSVRAATKVLDMIEKFWIPTQGGLVLHWFTGNMAEARRAVDLGCYFSINAMMMKTERHTKLIKSLPMDRLLTETDGPFTSLGGRPTKPADILETVTTLAALRGLQATDMALTVNQNLRRLVTTT